MSKTAINIPDCHIPWHDPIAYDVMLEIAKDVKPQEINIMGDFADFYWFGLHDKLPEMMGVKTTLKDEICAVIIKLRQLRKLFPNAKINYIEGNHEFRMARYLAKKAPEMFDIHSIVEILQLKELGITFHKYGKDQLVQCLDTGYMLRHEPYSAGENCAGATLKNGGISLGFGHTHRSQSFRSNRANGSEIEAHSMGWLGNHKEPVFSFIKGMIKWTQGFQIVTSIRSKAHIQNIQIKDGRAVYNGYVYEGADTEEFKIVRNHSK